ncbi:MAG: hypothetical protein BMS9Abin05_1584 [Rhodothermia bacterium]|nr:MAG: hypothetical protein BMS9Abin05_1584 [Rhodothermia bacterium]
MIELKKLKEIDPLVRNAEKHLDQSEFSPMDPPEAYSPPEVDDIDYSDLHSLFQRLMDDHKKIVVSLDAFERVLTDIFENGINQNVHARLSEFFRAFDELVLLHSQKEEKILFPTLQVHLLESGDHSQSAERRTAVDMLEDDHVKVIQLAAVTFNFFGLASRLPDPASTAIVMDAAVEQGRALVEALRLHIFRENTVVFPLAQKRISGSELDDLAARL